MKWFFHAFQGLARFVFWFSNLSLLGVLPSLCLLLKCHSRELHICTPFSSSSFFVWSSLHTLYVSLEVRFHSISCFNSHLMLMTPKSMIKFWFISWDTNTFLVDISICLYMTKNNVQFELIISFFNFITTDFSFHFLSFGERNHIYSSLIRSLGRWQVKADSGLYLLLR